MANGTTSSSVPWMISTGSAIPAAFDSESKRWRTNTAGNGNSGNHDHGPFGTRDPGFVASNIKVNAAGTQLTADVKIAASVSKGEFVVRVETPNGESSFVGSEANTLKVN